MWNSLLNLLGQVGHIGTFAWISWQPD